MSEEKLESRSLLDLATITRESRKLGIRLVLIGGYAVSAYSRGYRYTKDIDLVADKLAVGKLKGLLSSLSYSIRDTEFGLAGSKRLNEEFIDLHISVGKIHDASTNKDYPVDSTLFKNAKRLNVKGYYAKTATLRTHVVNLETLLLLKLMTTGRQKDVIDVLSLLLDRRNEVDTQSLTKMVGDVGLSKHILSRVRDYSEKLKKGELDRVWFTVTSSRLQHTQKQEIGRFFARLAELLRKSSLKT